MAFPVPSHLPRRAPPQDVTSKILSKIDDATNVSLNSELAYSWIRELEESIQFTKQRIHDRIQADLPNFKRQFQSSVSVETRLRTLTSNVDALSEKVSSPEQTGLIPTVIDQLTKHSALAQTYKDAEVKYETFSHLLRIRDLLSSLTTLVQAGKLGNAMQETREMERLMETAPETLRRVLIMEELTRKFRATKALAEEQLSYAYSRGIIVLPTELIIQKTVPVRQFDSVLSLSLVLSSLPPTSLSNHLMTLRRDLMAHFIDHVLKQPTSLRITSSGMSEHRLSLIPSPPNAENPTRRLDNLSEILDFLSNNMFPHFPPSQHPQFAQSLYKPVTTSVLEKLLIPSIPPSFGALSPFLGLVQRAVSFEQTFDAMVSGDERDDKIIQRWAYGVCGHYERQRRSRILDQTREIVSSTDGAKNTFSVEMDAMGEYRQPGVVAVQSEEIEQDIDSASARLDDAITNRQEEEPDGWGFDDDLDVEAVPETETMSDPKTTEQPPEIDMQKAEDEPDPSDAWGWNDDDVVTPDDEIPEETAWDDPWTDSPSSPISDPAPALKPAKVATRLEKLATKHKHTKDLSSSMSSKASINPVSSSSQPSSTSSMSTNTPVTDLEPQSARRPANVVTSMVVKESYTVTERVKRIMSLIENVLEEGNELAHSGLFHATTDGSPPGMIILQTAPLILDLYRALYPVRFTRELQSPNQGILFSNDCHYLSDEIARINRTIPASQNGHISLPEGLSECQRRLKILGNSWFDNTIKTQQMELLNLLVQGTQGFVDSNDQDRYDQCENVIGQVAVKIKHFAQQLKAITAKSKYYAAVGAVVDVILSRILQDIIALPDIPEAESHKLGELCRILNSLEGLFSEDPNKPSFVVAYVPSWLKFSYLSELLEASMADISYLFEEGALVDFEVDELVRLVRALFADTTLRTNTINKLLEGHPPPS